MLMQTMILQKLLFLHMSYVKVFRIWFVCIIDAYAYINLSTCYLVAHKDVKRK